MAAAAGRLSALLAVLPLDSRDLPLPAGAGYLELLAQMMADGVLTDAEVDALTDLATSAGLSRGQVHAAHRGMLLALARQVLADGRVTTAERAELLAQAIALGLDPLEVTAVLGQARTERTADLSERTAPLPHGWAHGAPLRVGQSVAFTGGGATTRALLERRTREAGLSVSSAVSARTAVLVTDEVTTGTAKARAALKHGTRVVDTATYTVLLEHVQPAEPAPQRALERAALLTAAPAEFAGTTASTTGSSAPSPRSGPEAMSVPALPATSSVAGEGPQPGPATGLAPAAAVELRSRPAQVRAWARAQGLQVSDRGRLPQHVLDAYTASTANTASHPTAAGAPSAAAAGPGPGGGGGPHQEPATD